MNLHHIESRPSKQSSTEFEFFVSCDNKTGGLQEALDALKKIAKSFRLLSRKTGEYPADGTGKSKSFGKVITRRMFYIGRDYKTFGKVHRSNFFLKGRGFKFRIILIAFEN